MVGRRATNAEKPSDWDEDEDGEWLAPEIDNPEYKGVWTPPQVMHPGYVGEWEHPMIDNPEYFDDPTIGIYTDLRRIGIEVWQVRSGSRFDAFLVTDDVPLANERCEESMSEIAAREKASMEALHAGTDEEIENEMHNDDEEGDIEEENDASNDDEEGDIEEENDASDDDEEKDEL